MQTNDAVAGGISVVLPAYNEAENLEEVVNSALEAIPVVTKDFEVIIVDDGSSDETASVARELVARHHPRVRLLQHTVNAGYGSAIRTGLAHGQYDLLFYTDTDRQFDLGEFAQFAPHIEGHDLVIGFRVYRYDTVLRSILSWCYNRVVGLLFRVRVRDVDCAYKLMRREVLDKLTLESTDFFIDTEIVARARKWNFRIAQRGVRHYPRLAGETTVTPSDVPRTLKTVIRMWRRIYLPNRTQRQEAEAGASLAPAQEVLPEIAKAK
jgi:glycosyltransferase involved in cell wall biosynthesis